MEGASSGPAVDTGQNQSASEQSLADYQQAQEHVHRSSQESDSQPQELLQVLQQLNAHKSATPPGAQNGSPVKEEPARIDVPSEPPSEWHALRSQLRDKPHDPEGWNKLVKLAEDSGDLDRIKETYEALLEMYPNSAAAQIAYLEHFLVPGYFPFAEELFKRFLRTSPAVELWKFYLTYVRRINLDASTRDIVRKAYEYALNHVGQDKDSSDIWTDYIQFLRSGETSSTWEEQQKMDALRKVYHRAVQIPLENVEQLWQELESFETGLNRITAKKFMNDLSPSYMQARTVLRQLQRHLGPLLPPPPPSSSSRPTLYLPALPTFNAAERALVGAWKNYLRWEEGNPLEIEEKDKNILITRVQSVYRKAVIRMRFFGEIWYMAYMWMTSVGKTEEAINLLKAGIEANPSSFLLNFAYAESLELNQQYAEVHTVFEKFIDALRVDLEQLETKIAASATPVPPPESSQQSEPVASFVTLSTEEKPPKSKELAEKRTEYGLAWTIYMRFARRAEGLKASRALFARARRDRWTPWEVYESAALAEYHLTKDAGIATRIFEKGLEVFADEVDLISHYLGFLLSVNDENNARALFERVISTFSPDRARPLWERWARHEYQYGDLAAAQKLEKRMAEVYPSDPPIKRFAQRHTYHHTDAIASRDLGVAMARQANGTGSTSSSNTSLHRSETKNSVFETPSAPASQPPHPPVSSHKRASSPEHKRRDESYGPPSYKRPRPSSPPGRDRDRWDGPGHGRRRYGSPSWDRDRERDPPPPRRNKEIDDEKPIVLPSVISQFIGQLPTPASFDGPVFRTDDLMQVFRNAVIPSVTGRVRSPPPPPRGGGRPPPDYGPYQGPGGGGRRRY
ncbi:Suf-domain-containing protein [Artomyces pyxidatus]|uniref:Suf-domain-containing protein n=1 Tax=Artomyces pyxidatus TaxID=48021 RepID=A0ACB8STU2_9AGAM|nr:Suf-domain-containing protein [Artomyces pyxidatus]